MTAANRRTEIRLISVCNVQVPVVGARAPTFALRRRHSSQALVVFFLFVDRVAAPGSIVVVLTLVCRAVRGIGMNSKCPLPIIQLSNRPSAHIIRSGNS